MQKLIFLLGGLLLAATVFSQDLAPKEKRGKWGYVTTDGSKEKVAIPYQFEAADKFSRGAAVVRTDGKYGLIDPQGNYLLPANYDTLYRAADHVVFPENGKLGVLDSLGQLVLPAKFDEVKTSVPKALVLRQDSTFYRLENGQPVPADWSELVFRTPDRLPTFAGCEQTADSPKARKACSEEQMLQFIFSNLKYPEVARKEGIDGMVVVAFIIDEEGRTTNAEIVRPIGGGCDEEVLRVVGTFPAWAPAQEEGRPVKCQFYLPVRFKLE